MTSWGIRWAAIAALVAGSGQAAWAGASLVVLEDNGADNAVYRRVMEGLGAVIVSNNLGRHYDRIDLLTGALATREKFFEKLRKRGARSAAVDVLILTHGLPGSLSLGSGDITEADIRAAGPFPNLRMVYMMACHGSTLVRAWTESGATVAVGHQDVNSLPGLFFPRFLRRWAEGRSAVEATNEAYRWATGAANLVSDYVATPELVDSVGIARSEPVIAGRDVNREGRVSAQPPRPITPLRVRVTPSSRPTYRHTDFEALAIQLIAAGLPQTSLDATKIPGAQRFYELTKDAAWTSLLDSFPPPLEGIPGTGVGNTGDETWIDGEALRYFLAPLKDWTGDKLDQVLESIEGARLERANGLLHVSVYFSRALELPVEDESRAGRFSLYSIHVPKTVRFTLSVWEGRLFVSGLAAGIDSLRFRVKLPALPDNVYLRNLSADLTTGKVRVEAGVVGDLVTVVANAELLARRFDGIDIWETISRNADVLVWPVLVFAIL